ncbi:MAG: CTP synthase, partial [Myxococcaceae bacterium]
NEALIHSGIVCGVKINFSYIDSEEIERDGAENCLKNLDAILVPGGFGERGTQGKIETVKYARENKIPFLGICLGLQIAVIEMARHKALIEHATSEEFNAQAKNQVIHFMADQQHVTHKGGTMRLGNYPCVIKKDTLAHKIYGKKEILERHRHRYEVNNAYRPQLEEAGLVFSGLSPDNNLVEIVEIKDHPFFIACQFHPEFLSKPLHPHPLFKAFVHAALSSHS